MTTAPLLALGAAVIGYAGTAVVHGIDLEVDAGEVVALLGSNGSGKSTLVRGVLGLAEQRGGEIDLSGVDRRHFGERWRIGYVPQRITIGGGLPATVAEVVTSGRLARLRPGAMLRKPDRAAVADAIETVGLEDASRRQINTLSGGQMRRAIIARALASTPELLILDEPTAGVDAENQDRLAITLAELVRRGTTIILVTHEIGPVESLITRVVEMSGGTIRSDGPAAGVSHDSHDHGSEHQHPHGEPPAGTGPGLMRW